MNSKIRFKQLLDDHAELYVKYERPGEETIIAMAKALYDQSYREEKLEFALKKLSENATRRYPSINEIKIAGDNWREPPRESVNDNAAQENTEMYRKYFNSTIEAVGKEAYATFLFGYMKKVFNDSEAAKSIAVDFNAASQERIFNSLLNRLALRHLRMAKGNPAQAFEFGIKGA